MKTIVNTLLAFVSQPVLLLILLMTTACQSDNWQGIQSSQVSEMSESIRTETPGDYFIGRRYYKQDYKFWGWVRKPGQPWSSARLIMMNEQKKLAPDREKGTLGSDNGYEYKLYGNFSGETVYEPASNGFYPEFILSGYELRSTNPPSIYRNVAGALDPTRRVIEAPH